MGKHKSEGLPQELKNMVKWSVAILGDVIKDQLGKPAFERIEKTRSRMADLRGKPSSQVSVALEEVHQELKKLSRDEKRDFARAYTLMLELMNGCENAYRTYRLKLRKRKKSANGAEAIYFVLTAHPTESRAPENISIFHEIQKVLTDTYEHGFEMNDVKIKSLLEIAWKTEIVRMRKPKVSDEAEHIYSILLRDVNLSVLLDHGRSHSPVFIRSWVGGDKDGHPGVDENAMAESLQMSRNCLHDYGRKLIREYGTLIQPLGIKELSACLSQLNQFFLKTKKLRSGDSVKIRKISVVLKKLQSLHHSNIGKNEPESLSRLGQIFQVFPGLVVPLELREDSSVLMSDPTGNQLAIGRMLKKIGQFAAGDDPCLYARGLIISMAQSVEHIKTAGKILKNQVGNSKIPIVPLFEQKRDLESGSKIIQSLLADREILQIIKKDWGGIVEVMVGYSDSAKESGVLSSRLAILDSIVSIEKVCKKAGVKAVFFHGSGGSVDRGGGAIRDQIAGWPKNALNVYKATVQGEMVERTFASPEILESQLEQISENTDRSFQKTYQHQKSKVLEDFAKSAMNHYQSMITNLSFLKMVQAATPYSYLSALKIGSRPTKRSTGELTVSSLRAIPWVLCWTQTRILFPTWWGVGSAWKHSKPSEKNKIKKEFITHPVFRTYVHALGFTLAKIELPVFEFYLKNSSLSTKDQQEMMNAFRSELQNTIQFFEQITGTRKYLWFRPWLAESIELRSSMIHPLNILEIMAQKESDFALLRMSVTGIASGMLTTG